MSEFVPNIIAELVGIVISFILITILFRRYSDSRRREQLKNIRKHIFFELLEKFVPIRNRLPLTYSLPLSFSEELKNEMGSEFKNGRRSSGSPEFNEREFPILHKMELDNRDKAFEIGAQKTDHPFMDWIIKYFSMIDADDLPKIDIASMLVTVPYKISQTIRWPINSAYSVLFRRELYLADQYKPPTLFTDDELIAEFGEDTSPNLVCTPIPIKLIQPNDFFTIYIDYSNDVDDADLAEFMYYFNMFQMRRAQNLYSIPYFNLMWQKYYRDLESHIQDKHKISIQIENAKSQHEKELEWMLEELSEPLEIGSITPIWGPYGESDKWFAEFLDAKKDEIWILKDEPKPKIRRNGQIIEVLQEDLSSIATERFPTIRF